MSERVSHRWRLLDLFSCEGIGALGYRRAGFDVTGVDIIPRYAGRYPGRFVCADALTYLREHGHEYHAIHASPPCHGYTIATSGLPDREDRYPRLIEPVREALIGLGLPYVIENVPGAPLRDPLVLCGSHFGLMAHDEDGTLLRLERHRHFESNIPLPAPTAPHRHNKTIPVGGVYGGGRCDRWEAKHIRRGGYTPCKAVREALIGVPPGAFTLHGLSQSIPPAYTEYIGTQLINYLEETS